MTDVFRKCGKFGGDSANATSRYRANGVSVRSLAIAEGNEDHIETPLWLRRFLIGLRYREWTLNHSNSNDTTDFESFLARLRQNDDDAIRAFVSKYEPFIRRTLRFRIARASLQSAADSVDVCQSVLGGFLLRLAAGDYSLATEEDLRRLLVAIANKKFLILNRREKAAKRDHRQTKSLQSTKEVAINDATLGHFEYRELFNEVTQRLAPEEHRLFAMRREGLSWSVIAEQISEDPMILRKRLSRALQRIAVELKLEEDDGS